MAELPGQAPPLLCPTILDMLRQRAESLLDIYRAHAEALFPLSAILLSAVTASNALRSSASLWNKQSQGAVISSYHGLVRVLNDIANYLEQMGVCAHMEPLVIPFLENTSFIAHEFHEITLALNAPCFLYNGMYSSNTLCKPHHTPAEPLYKRFLSYFGPYLHSTRPSLSRESIISAYKRQCLELILSETISTTSKHEAPYHVLVILATVSASSLNARSTIFLYSPSTQSPNRDSALLIIPGPIPRREVIAPNLQIVKITGQIPPVDFKQHAETLSFIDTRHTRPNIKIFSRKRAISWQVVSPSHTGVLLPFMQVCSNIRSWTSIAKAVRIYSSSVQKKSLMHMLRLHTDSQRRLKQHKPQQTPSFSFKRVPRQTSLFTSRGSIFLEAIRIKKALSANCGSLFCCRMSPGEYNAQLPFQVRIPLALSQHSTPLLRVKKQFTPSLAPSSLGIRMYTFTVQLRLPDDLDSRCTMYISKISLHFSGASGAVSVHGSPEPLSIPCSCELPVGKFITNRESSTEYGLYSLHTQKIEWQPSSIKRYSNNITSCVSLSIQYYSNYISEAVVYPVVDVSIDSSAIPDVVYITDIIP